MTDALRNQAFNMHNYYRRLLASGWAKDAKLIYAKPSQAMPALTVLEQWWSPLEKIGNEDNTYTQANQATLGTYINIAHHKATKVGCGVQTCAKIGKTLVQCAYEGVPTIPDDDPIYPVGKTCSKCGTLAATPKCSPLGGLCTA
ncbi:SCP-like protein [Ancylostoma duodenale]|uniref:SCP-like protein n=1 Tax=Ancylostoma duodenale TaxID=51022 RepID=A0A0C2FZW3_9BILA|nr:SCP-like protein [Ancylostoma duodenale]